MATLAIFASLIRRDSITSVERNPHEEFLARWTALRNATAPLEDSSRSSMEVELGHLMSSGLRNHTDSLELLRCPRTATAGTLSDNHSQISEEERIPFIGNYVETVDSLKLSTQCPRKGERRGLRRRIRKFCKRFVSTPIIQIYRKRDTRGGSTVANAYTEVNDGYDGPVNKAAEPARQADANEYLQESSSSSQ